MTSNRLAAFAAVAKHRNITKAAQELRVSQPSVTKHIKALEKQYQVELIDRQSANLELTSEGRLLLRYANDILSLLKQLDHELGILQREQKVDTLRVGASHGASTLLLPSLVARFKQLHPEIPIALRIGSSKMLEKMLMRGHVEIALVHIEPDRPNICAEFFREERLIAFVARNHPLATQKHVKISAINANQLAATGGRNSTTEKILKSLSHEGLKTRIRIRCETPEAVKIIVSKGTAIGFLFEDTVVEEIKKGLFKALNLHNSNLKDNSDIVHRNDKALSSNAREFLGILRQWRRTS